VAIDRWAASNAAPLERYLAMVAEIRASRAYTLTTLPVALRELSATVASSSGPASFAAS
jgi:NAD-specific glutamate dehydrogenase